MPIAHSPPDALTAQHTLEGRRLMVGLLVGFFGMMLIANAAVLWFAMDNAPEVEPTYAQDRR